MVSKVLRCALDTGGYIGNEDSVLAHEGPVAGAAFGMHSHVEPGDPLDEKHHTS